MVYKMAMDWAGASAAGIPYYPADGLVRTAAIAHQSYADAGGLPHNGNILPAVRRCVFGQYGPAIAARAIPSGHSGAKADDGDAPLHALADG